MPSETQTRTSPVVVLMGRLLAEGFDLETQAGEALATRIHDALYDAGYEITRRIQEPICGCGHPPRHHDKQSGRCYGRGCECGSYTKA